MKIILNNYIPFYGYIAMAVYGMIFWRKEYLDLMDDPRYYTTVINHESIHIEQMKDFCKWIPVGGTIFYIIYVLEWLFRFFTINLFNIKESYKNISFEQEAYKNEKNIKYIEQRKHFAQWKKLESE